MKILKGIGITLLALFIILLVGGLLLPSHYRVERSRTIAATIPDIQAQITDLHNAQAWNPYVAHDPAMQVTYGTPAAGLGAHYSWTSDKIGNGSLTIDHISPDSVREQLDFGPDIPPPVATFYFKPEGNATQVRWAMRGDLGGNPFLHWYGLVMDHFIGGDYEKGLANLAARVEKK